MHRRTAIEQSLIVGNLPKVKSMHGTLVAAAAILMITAVPTGSRADAVGAVFGAGSGLVIAGPPGAVVGGIVGAV